MLRITLILFAVLLGSTSALANNCAIYGGGSGESYGLIAVGSLAELATFCDDNRVPQCTLTCSSTTNVRCKGIVGTHPEHFKVVARGNTFAEVEASCASQNKKCDIVCGNFSNIGNPDNGAGGPGDR